MVGILFNLMLLAFVVLVIGPERIPAVLISAHRYEAPPTPDWMREIRGEVPWLDR